MKIPISERALLARINRILYQENKILKKNRDKNKNIIEIGKYFLVDKSINQIILKRVNLENYGRQLNVIKEYEELDGF